MAKKLAVQMRSVRPRLSVSPVCRRSVEIAFQGRYSAIRTAMENGKKGFEEEVNWKRRRGRRNRGSGIKGQRIRSRNGPACRQTAMGFQFCSELYCLGKKVGQGHNFQQVAPLNPIFYLKIPL